MKRITNGMIKPHKSIGGKIIIIIFIIGLVISIIALKNFLTIRAIIVVIDSQDSEEGKETKITKENILELCNLKVGDKLYKELRSQIAERIEKNPYVKEAKIERNLSGKLKITVTRKNS